MGYLLCHCQTGAGQDKITVSKMKTGTGEDRSGHDQLKKQTVKTGNPTRAQNMETQTRNQNEHCRKKNRSVDDFRWGLRTSGTKLIW
jgi:hypothetical protein